MPTYRANFRKDNNNAERRNSLGLDGENLNRLFDILDGQKEGEANLKRVHVRWPFRQESLTFRIIEGVGGRREFKVAARNLSNSGLSVIHNSYVYPGVDCEVELPSNVSGNKSTMRVPGKVRRCSHIQGVVHEVGISFDEPIDARLFLSLDNMPAYYSLEMIDTNTIEGTVLHVEDSALDRRLFAHYLADTRVIIKSAESIEEAKNVAKDNFDLVVLDYMLPDGNGGDFVNWMRDNGILTPCIVLTADTSHQTHQMLQHAEINGLLVKPVDEGTLLRAVTEFLSTGDDNSTQSTNNSMRELTSTFIGELGKMIDDLRACQERDDAMSAYTIALRLKGTAPALGFDRLANVSERAASVLAASMSCEESQRQLDALLDACERIKHRRAG